MCNKNAATTHPADFDDFIVFALAMTLDAATLALDAGLPPVLRVSDDLTLFLPTQDAWSRFLGYAPLSLLGDVMEVLRAKCGAAG